MRAATRQDVGIHMRSARSPGLIALLLVALAGCGGGGDTGSDRGSKPDGAGLGINKITAFSVSSATHPVIQVAQAPGVVEQTSTGGRLSAILPGGTDPRVTVAFATDGGTVTANGAAIASPAIIDLSTVRQLLVTDTAGNVRPYSLDVGDTGLPSVFIRTNGVPIDSRDVYVAGDITIMGGHSVLVAGLSPVTKRMSLATSLPFSTAS